MTTSETTRQREKREWLETQSDQVRLNTVLVDRLARCLSDKTPEQVARHLANCMKNRVWEQGHWDIAVSGQFYAHTYENGMEFIRERLKVQPAELMNMIIGVAPDPVESATAAIELVHEVKASEPETFALMLDPDNPKNWRELLATNERREGGPWIEAAAELDRAITTKPGSNGQTIRPVDTELLKRVREAFVQYGTARKVKEALRLTVGIATINRWMRGERLPRVESNPLVSHNRIGSGIRQPIRRKLERFCASPELCAEKGTSVERVKKALIDLHNGKAPTTCEREAGIAAPFTRRRQLRVAGDPDDIARRLITLVGTTNAQAIAHALMSKLSSN